MHGRSPVSSKNEEALSRVKEMLVNLEYGTITLVVQDGKIVQLEKNEKWRTTEKGKKTADQTTGG